MRDVRRAAAAMCVAALLAACSSAGVQITKSDQADPTASTVTDDTTGNTTTDDTTDDTTGDTTISDPGQVGVTGTTAADDGLPDIDAVIWSRCDTQPAPWQCGSIDVPLDYGDLIGEQISIALTRLPATEQDQRIGSLLLNPGGPGGSGLELAYGEAADFPKEVTDRFDLVGFDPRGVGHSTAATCPPGFDPSDDDYRPCIDDSGDLLAYLGTPNVARDLEMIRRAVRDDGLTYLGYSYGTALGAVYADLFPQHVRAMVLDGAVDPDAGESNEPGGGGYDFYAQQDFDGTTRTFQDLCDASDLCAAGPHARQLMNRVSDSIDDIPTPYFDGGPLDSLDSSDVDDIVQSAMYSISTWSVLAEAFADADEGDASTLAAMYSWLQFGYPADMESEPNYDFANVAIRCADFVDRSPNSFFCSDFPTTDDPMPVIDAVDAAAPILVVGTDGDPATPGRYAEQLADALGDAVYIEWKGAGHTAYLTSKCITTIVTAYIVDQTVPDNGKSCPFISDIEDTVSGRADTVFGPLAPARAVAALVPVLVAQGNDQARSTCIAQGIIQAGDQRLIIHQILGVESPDLVGLRGLIEGRCR